MVPSKPRILTFKKHSAMNLQFCLYCFQESSYLGCDLPPRELDININVYSLKACSQTEAPLKHLGQRGIWLNVIDFPLRLGLEVLSNIM